MRRAWTEQEIRALGTRTDVPTAGAIIGGLSATQAYELHKRGGFPVPVLKVGHRLIVPTAPILAALGLAALAGDQAASGSCDQPGQATAAGGAVLRLAGRQAGDGR